MNSYQKKAFGLVEVVIASALLTLIVVGIQVVTQSALETSKKNLKETKAAFLLTEGAEAMRILRDNAWSNVSTLSTSTSYYLTFSTSTNNWRATTSPNTIDNAYTRTVAVSDIVRDGSDNIATSGTYDSGTKKVSVNVSWQTLSGTTTKSLELYLSNI